MAKDRAIVYEPHPVSHERKRELMAKGLKIIDARFAPEGYSPPSEDIGPATEDLDAMSVDELHAIAKKRGVDVHHKAGADKVREALRQAAKD